MKSKETDDRSSFVNKNVPARSKPVYHQGVDSPLCQKCRDLNLSFFDPQCPGCSSILQNPRTTVSQIFAIIRQWMPQVQKNIGMLIREMLKKGCNVNDRDGLTDMTMLHYASKSGASGVGDIAVTCDIVQELIKQGADFTQKCRWTDMLPLHYATFFDVVPVMEILLMLSGSADADCPCKEFENGTPLHIACSNLCYNAAQCLLKHKANPKCFNNFGRTPRQCIPDASTTELSSNDIILKMQNLLLEAENSPTSPKQETLGMTTLQALGLAIGDKVIISGQRGILKFCGPTEFASGHWAGIELNDAVGKNDGSVASIRYFDCQPKHGIFVPLSRVRKAAEADENSISVKLPNEPSQLLLQDGNGRLQIGDRVLVAGQKVGIIRFMGETQFAPGVWVGVELDEPHGKNDGSVSGVRYFECRMNYGIFAQQMKIQRCEHGIPKSHESLRLKPGMSVFVNNELGIVRHIGNIHFADGVWLGIELRRPVGKNDGSVGDHRYFTCKQNFGLFIRPNRATCRGINCAQLLPAT